VSHARVVIRAIGGRGRLERDELEDSPTSNQRRKDDLPAIHGDFPSVAMAPFYPYGWVVDPQTRRSSLCVVG